MTDDFAVEGEDGAYVPCFELAAVLDAEEEGAVFGIAGGFVARDEGASDLPGDEREAIVGSGVGFVPKPCVVQLLVAGRAGKMASSDDAIDWEFVSAGFTELGAAATPPDEGTIVDMAWSPDLSQWVAVGTHGRLATSPDGINWTHQAVGIPVPLLGSVTITCAEWSSALSLWAIGASSNEGIWTSPDGVTWTDRANGNVNSIVWSPELALFVAVGVTPAVRTSPDGITWTTQTSAVASLSDVAWSPELDLFVAVGGDAHVQTSPDGVTWTEQTSPFTIDDITAVAWSPSLGLWVIVGGWVAVGTSPDGINWTLQTTGLLGGAGAPVNDVEWSSTLGMFVMTGNSTGNPAQTSQVATSSNGTSWTYRNDARTETGFTGLNGVGVAES